MKKSEVKAGETYMTAWSFSRNYATNWRRVIVLVREGDLFLVRLTSTVNVGSDTADRLVPASKLRREASTRQPYRGMRRRDVKVDGVYYADWNQGHFKKKSWRRVLVLRLRRSDGMFVCKLDGVLSEEKYFHPASLRAERPEQQESRG